MAGSREEEEGGGEEEEREEEADNTLPNGEKSARGT